MKSIKVIARLAFVFVALVAYTFTTQAQKIDYWRPYDQRGINMFEPPKTGVETDFSKLQVRIGGSFAQQYQSLEHSTEAFTTDETGNRVPLELYPLAPGFNLATANMYVDVQMADGIRLAVESYMSSRHHPEFWVKGGYIQIDKLPMFGNPQWFTDNLRVKIGHFQVNYGDQQFRRSDNGNAMYNPFVGNYMMDAFATEIGGEAYLFLPGGFMGMVGMTSGYINGNVEEGDNRSPSIYAKLAYDKQINPDFRFRLSGSVYNNSGVGRNTLYSGDRGGSRYYLVMEAPGARAGSDFRSGRVNPNIPNELTSIMINPFVKFGGLEFFGTFETTSGLRYGGDVGPDDERRSFTQVAGELLYRFPAATEDFYVGTRYQTATGEFEQRGVDANVNRIEFAAGWFPIDNLLLKVAYQQQNYDENWSTDNLFFNGEFNGIVIEAVAGF